MIVHITLMVFLLLINLIPQNMINRKKYILPLSFFIIFVYWAIRYNYGLDYWNYYKMFYLYGIDHSLGFSERWFYLFFHAFSRYYQVIIVESAIIVVSLFYIVRKHVPVNCYWLFFLLLFAVPSLHFNLISAQRSTMAACILYWAFDLFFITKIRWSFFYLFVIIALMFHTTAILFVLIPIVYKLFSMMRGKSVLFVLLICDFLSMFYLSDIFKLFISLSTVLGEYDYYSDLMIESNFNGFLYKSLILIPTYFVCEIYDSKKNDVVLRRIFILAFYFILISMLGVNFQGRYTVYLYPYFIMALAITDQYYYKNRKQLRVSRNLNINHKYDMDKRKWMLVPYLLITMIGLLSYYHSMLSQMNTTWREGNTYYYSTIFDAPYLP